MIEWKFKNRRVIDPPPEAYGFTYCVVTDDGKKYFGKKVLSFTKKKILSAKKKKELNTRKKYETVVSDSGWREYCGSCLPLLQYLKEGGQIVSKTILAFAYSKMDLTYAEMVLLVKERVLFRDDVWNSNILSKFFRGKINEI